MMDSSSDARLAALMQENADLKTHLAACQAELTQERAAQERADLLSTVAQVTNLLLRSSGYATVLADVARLLGEAVGSDRCVIAHTLNIESGQIAVEVLEAWFRREDLAVGILDSDPESVFLIDDHWQAFYHQFVQGKTANYIVNELPEPMRSYFDSLGAASMLLVPVMVEGRLWGSIGFDNCNEARLYNEAEIAILQVAAESIAAAVERDLIQKAILQAEQRRSQELGSLNAELQQTLEQLSESEKRYRTLLELSNAGIFRFEMDLPISTALPVEEQVDLVHQHCRFVGLNEAFYPQMGVSNHDELARYTLGDFYVNNLDHNRKVSQALIENGYRIKNAETDETNALGERKFFLNNLFCDVRDGYMWGGWGIQTDITELKQAQQALLQAEKDRVAELAKANGVLKRGLKQFTETGELNAFLGHLLQEISQQTGACAGHIFVYDSNTNTFELRRGIFNEEIYSHALPDDPRPFRSSFPAEFINIFPYLCKTRQLFSKQLDSPATTQMPSEIRQWHDQRQHRQFALCALLAGDQPVGMLGLAFRQPVDFKPEVCELIDVLTDQASLVIHLTQLAEERRQAAIIQERNSAAREIHDTLAQDFAGILIQLQAAERFANPHSSKARIRLKRARDLARKGLAEARSSIWALSQEGEAYSNLASVLTQLAEQITVATETQISMTVAGAPYPLPPEIGMHLLRIAQEACNNALQHAQADTIQIHLCYAEQVFELRIVDDGIGFDTQRLSQGFGLKGMRQRADSIAAALTVSSDVNKGTEVRASLPIRQA